MMPGFRRSFQFEDEYKAILDYATNNAITKPNGFVRQTQNRLMVKFLGTDFHSGADRYYIFAGDASARDFSLINWKSPGTDDATEHGTLTYGTNGFTGDGSTGYLNTHFTPSTDGVNFTLNSAGINTHCASLNAAEDRAFFGVRNTAATAQVTVILRSVAAADNTRFTLNDNTNSDYASSVMSRGMYGFDRTASNAKVINRRTLSPSGFVVNSIARPDGDIYLLARNSLSTAAVDLFSNATISFFRVGSVLNSGDRSRMVNDYTSYFRQVQLPIFYVTSAEEDGETSKVVYTTSSPTTWDDGSIFGAARYTAGGYDFELYGGTADAGADPIGYSAGAFDFTTALTGTKDSNNPLVDVADYPTLDSIFPMDQLTIGSTIYWFFTVRLDGVITHDTYIASSSTSDPKNIGTLTALITVGGVGHFNHGFRIIRDHPDTDYWYAIIAQKNVLADPFQLNVIRCLRANDITNGANWSSVNTNIVSLPSNIASSANLSQVYNYCFYDTVDSNYKLLYGRFFDEKKADSFTIFATESASLSSFPIGLEALWPTGSLDVLNDTDAGYTSLPYLVPLGTNHGLIFYGARQGGGSAPYIARDVKQYYIR